MGAEQGPSFRSKLSRQTKNKTSLQLTAHTSRHSSLPFFAFVIKSGSSRPASRGRQAEPGFRHKAFKKQFSRDWASGPPDCHRSVLFLLFAFFDFFFEGQAAGLRHPPTQQRPVLGPDWVKQVHAFSHKQARPLEEEEEESTTTPG